MPAWESTKSVIGMCDKKKSTTKQSHGRARSDAAGIYAVSARSSCLLVSDDQQHRQAWSQALIRERAGIGQNPDEAKEVSSGALKYIKPKACVDAVSQACPPLYSNAQAYCSIVEKACLRLEYLVSQRN